MSEAGESDLRRRAAWLLAMLAVVAALFVLLFTTVLSGSGGSGKKDNQGAPDDTLRPTATSRPTNSPSKQHTPHSSANPGPSGSQSVPSTGEPSGPVTTTCPSTQPCILQGDSANVIAAINRYRSHNGQDAIEGKVSKSAQQCALSNGGDGCSGGWAESQVDKLDGQTAVDKISKLGKLLDPQLKSIEVGWAFAPAEKQYYIAIVRND